MLLIRPVYLFDVGAQLSFAAVAGIVVLHRRWYLQFFVRHRFLCFRLEHYHLMDPLSALSVSVAAQLFTLPLVAYYFHRIPLYAPLFSPIYIFFITILIYGALTLLVLSLLSASLSFVPFFATLPSLMGRALSWIVVVQMAVMHFEVRLPGVIINDFWSRKAESQIVVYNNWRCPALHVIAAPDKSWLLMPEPDSLQTGMRYIAESFWRKRLTAEPIVLTDRTAVAIEDGFKAVMIKSDVQTAARSNEEDDGTAACIDVLWLTKGFKSNNLHGLEYHYHPRLVVLDASLSSWQRAGLQEDAVRVGWPVYDVAEQGALTWHLVR